MKFDRRAPGEGIEAVCSLENGKAVLEWKFYFTKTTENQETAQEGDTGSVGCCSAKSAGTVRFALADRQGNMVAEGIQPLWEEEPLRSILLQPRLWRGVQDPYLYRLEAILTDRNGICLDRISRHIALRTFSGAACAGTFSLNGEVFERRAVSYLPPEAASEAERQRLMTEDLQQMLRLGANCIYVQGRKGLGKLFLHLCDRLGLLLFDERDRDEHMGIRSAWAEAVPVFRGEKGCLFSNSGMPASLFYRYLAKWSEEPFVYIVPESVKRLADGNYIVHCYSNCTKVALYSDGTLFAFQRGEGEFIFSEVPARTPCILLAAEGDGCSASLSLSKLTCQSAEKSGICS